MTEHDPDRRDDVLKRAQEIYERLAREQRWDFHNIPSAPPPPPPSPGQRADPSGPA
jgi:hypothetical protein